MSYKILGDVHTHTLYSCHAYSTIAENVSAAKAAGLEVLGSTDHFSNMLIPGDPHLSEYQFFMNTEVWPRTWGGVLVLHGCEADIVGLDGSLFGQDVSFGNDISRRRLDRDYTLYERVTRSCDYAIASVHNPDFADGASVAHITDMYVGALEQEKVLILGHTGRAGLPYDLDTVLTCAKERHKLIEINEHSLESGPRCHEVCRSIAERCAELGVGIAVSSDAHVAPCIGAYPTVTAMLEEIHFPQELIMNRSAAAFTAVLSASGVCPQL